MQQTELKQLPDWLLEQLPKITEPAILSLWDTKLVVTYPDRMEAIHESLKDVQHQIHHVKPKDSQILPEGYLMCADKTGGFNLVNYRHSSGVYHEQETEDLHRRI
ncbi:hypothetical protein [Acinetobacter johnsonii]|uniref:hypothetical protein n=1 Tax=Acinetobacter johnsonii TaxID=40214 RepID=UPI0032B3A74B